MSLWNRILVVLFFAQAVAISMPRKDGTSCADILASLDFNALAQVKPEFLAKHNDLYTIEVPITPVKNQCNYGGCWVYARLGAIEQEHLKNTGETLNLSETYLIARSLYDRSLLGLEDPRNIVQAGGTAPAINALIDRYGLVPEGTSGWAPRINFENSPISLRMLDALNGRIARFHIKTAEMEHTEPAFQIELDNAKNDLKEILKAYVGEFPTGFDVNGVHYTSPKDYASKAVKADLGKGDLVKIKRLTIPEELKKLSKRTDALPEPKPNTNLVAYEIPTTSLSVDETEKKIVAALSKGQTVTLSYENERSFIDSTTGIMSLAAFHMPEGFVPPPKAYRNAFDLQSGNHAVDIVGVELDESGKVIRYKLKNSWGLKSGDNGIYHMYADYFRSFANSVYFPNGI